MKIKHLKVSAIVMTGCLVASSCVGSFQLTHKLAMWNTRATDTKFLNEIIFLLISPAYAVCGVVDALVINSMEFWSGSNPLAKNEGKTQNVMGQDGRYYAVTTLKNGYEIKKPDGEIMKFLYDNKTDSWSQVVDGKTKSARITIVPKNNGQEYIVLSGLEAGDKIVASGAGLLREGMPIVEKAAENVQAETADAAVTE